MRVVCDEDDLKLVREVDVVYEVVLGIVVGKEMECGGS